MADKKHKRIASFVHKCDDFTMSDEEGEFQPHAGEWVRFRQDLPWFAVGIGPGMETDVFTKAVIDLLTRQILGWNWTDWDGENLPQPSEDGFEDALYGLSTAEIRYLRENCWKPSQVGEA